MRKSWRAYIQLILPTSLIVIFDQWTKWLVSSSLALGESWSPWPWLMPYARFVHWSNTGSAFGMFQSLGTLFAILAVFVSIFIIYYYPKIEPKDWLVRLALILQLGGAVGNLVDRIRQGYVTDFISVGNFAVFNVADSCISIGVVVLILGMYIHDNREKLKVSDSEGETKTLDSPDRMLQDRSGE